MYKTIVSCVVGLLMLVSTVVHADVMNCDRMINFIKLGKGAELCLNEVQKHGKTALDKSGVCKLVAELNPRYGMASLAVMNPIFMARCMVQFQDHFDKAQEAIGTWSQMYYSDPAHNL